MAPSRASPLRGPCRKVGVEEKRRAVGSYGKCNGKRRVIALALCYKNGMPISDHPVPVNHADFVSCYKGRSYAIDDDEAVIIPDTETTLTGPPLLTAHHSNCNGHVPHLGDGAGSLSSSGPAL